MSTASPVMRVHHGKLWRRPAPTMEFGTPTGDEPRVVVVTFECRLSWEGGFEIAGSRTDAKAQTRNGRIFVPYDALVPFQRSDQISIDEFPGPLFEVDFNRLIWDFAAPHHWELDVSQVVGD